MEGLFGIIIMAVIGGVFIFWVISVDYTEFENED